jgi:hypothetical protein
MGWKGAYNGGDAVCYGAWGGSRRVWSSQLSPTSGEKGLSRTPAAFQTSAGDHVAEDNVKASILSFRKVL